MPNDAKLGMVIGIGLVLLIAVVFFRKNAPAYGPQPPAPAAVGVPGATPPAASREWGGYAPGSPTAFSGVPAGPRPAALPPAGDETQAGRSDGLEEKRPDEQ